MRAPPLHERFADDLDRMRRDDRLDMDNVVGIESLLPMERDRRIDAGDAKLAGRKGFYGDLDDLPDLAEACGGHAKVERRPAAEMGLIETEVALIGERRAGDTGLRESGCGYAANRRPARMNPLRAGAFAAIFARTSRHAEHNALCHRQLLDVE